MWAWSVLMPVCVDLPWLKYTVRPWVRAGLPLAMPVTSSSGLSSPVMTDGTDGRMPTIRLVDSLFMGELQSIDGSRPNSAPPTRDTPTPISTPALKSLRPSFEQDTTGRGTHQSVLFGPRNKKQASPQTPPIGRVRGMTVPLMSSSPATPERNSDSALSFTPSTSSKHIAHWFSGLLGR